MHLENYNKNNVDKDGKIIILIIEKILKLLIDRKSRTKVLAISKSIV